MDTETEGPFYGETRPSRQCTLCKCTVFSEYGHWRTTAGDHEDGWREQSHFLHHCIASLSEQISVLDAALYSLISKAPCVEPGNANDVNPSQENKGNTP